MAKIIKFVSREEFEARKSYRIKKELKILQHIQSKINEIQQKQE